MATGEFHPMNKEMELRNIELRRETERVASHRLWVLGKTLLFTLAVWFMGIVGAALLARAGWSRNWASLICIVVFAVRAYCLERDDEIGWTNLLHWAIMFGGAVGLAIPLARL